VETDWDDGKLDLQTGPLEGCLQVSRLIGQNETLVLPYWGGVSIKIPTENIFRNVEDVLWISAAGQGLREIQAEDFTPLNNAALASLLTLDLLTEEQYINFLYCSRVAADAPPPPPEAILHAILPGRYVFHVFPEALLVIANSARWKERLEWVYQNKVLVTEGGQIDFACAKAVAAAIRNREGDAFEAVLIADKGLFVFSDDPREAYERTLNLASRAEGYLMKLHAWDLNPTIFPAPVRPLRHELPVLRNSASELAGYPLLLTMQHERIEPGICQPKNLPEIFQKGAVTPAQASLLKTPPLLRQDLESGRQQIETASERDQAGSKMFNLPPTLILDKELGLLTVSRNAEQARLMADAYRQASRVLLRAQALGDYQPLYPPERQKPPSTIQKLSQTEAIHKAEMFAGEIALVTGGASGIGKACVESLLRRGAAVVSLDINPTVRALYQRADYLGLECDLTEETAVMRGFEAAARTFGGLDMLVLNAGIFPPGIRIESLDLDSWQRVMRINLDSYLTVMREAYPLLKCSPRGGRVVLNASKNVLAPGSGAAAYSSSKAAVTQLCRVAALEWGKDRIRINIIHPDAVFDTGIWTEEVLQARAAYYGLTLQGYKTRNLLGVELNSHDVGELVAEMLGPLFEKITGAQIPVDGGSDRVI
jgi:NAD(P)-dependent dehydrogenase (short-subunit alcohol dehydrogenase family)/rhamnose utilization protein RhaD (predicted bifunctional aldolase and dehydrogenase)